MQATALVNQLKISKLDQKVFWCDSTVVLGYIKNRQKRFHTYVSNRVQQIHDLSIDKQWIYVTSETNPADIASRGTSIGGLTSSMWFDGPKFLWNADISDMLKPTHYELPADDPEVITTSHAIQTEEKFSINHRLERFSTLKSAIRGVCFIQDKILTKKNLTSQSDIQARRKRALNEIIVCTQREIFMMIISHFL